MKARSPFVPLGIALLLVVSLFSYSRVEISENVTTKWNVDGAALAVIILCVSLFVIGRRIRSTIRLTLRRAGLSPEVSIPSAYRWVLFAAVPFFLISYGETSTLDGVTKSLGFGTSPFKLAVFALLVVVLWLVALGRRLGDLSEHLANSPIPPASRS